MLSLPKRRIHAPVELMPEEDMGVTHTPDWEHPFCTPCNKNLADWEGRLIRNHCATKVHCEKVQTTKVTNPTAPKVDVVHP